jgi:hypothetical protein
MILIGPLVQESSITEEVEAELRPASSASSHTPILASKKLRQPRDESLPSPRGLMDSGSGRLNLPNLAPSGQLISLVLFDSVPDP